LVLGHEYRARRRGCCVEALAEEGLSPRETRMAGVVAARFAAGVVISVTLLYASEKMTRHYIECRTAATL
jgi:hypothetical protein